MKKERIIQYILFAIGIVIVTLGGRLMFISGLGIGGLDALVVGLTRLFGLTFGAWIALRGITMIIIGAIIRKKWHWGPIWVSIIMGLVFDLWGMVFFDYVKGPTSRFMIGIVFLVGVVVTALGSAIYILPGLSTGPVDYLMLAIRERYKMSLQASRMLLEVTFFILGWVVGGPIGWGSVFIALLFAPIFQAFYNMVKLIAEKFNFKATL